MTKTLKILLIILAIVVVGAGTFFGVRYYQGKNEQAKTVSEDEAWEEYNEYLRQTTVLGTIKEISDNKIMVVKDDGSEVEYEIFDSTIYEKLGEPAEDGSAEFISASKDDLAKDQSVWLFFDDDNKKSLSLIKIIDSDTSNLPTPTPIKEE